MSATHYIPNGGKDLISLTGGFIFTPCEWNAMKYLIRMDRKGQRQSDIAKARDYVQRDEKVSFFFTELWAAVMHPLRYRALKNIFRQYPEMPEWARKCLQELILYRNHRSAHLILCKI